MPNIVYDGDIVKYARAVYEEAHKWFLWNLAGLGYGALCIASQNERSCERSMRGLEELVLLNIRGAGFLTIICAVGAFMYFGDRRHALKQWRSAIMQNFNKPKL